jgi:hypothetical protein
MTADILTESLPKHAFQYLCSKLGLVDYGSRGSVDMQPESRLPIVAYNDVVSETKAPYA